jgi:hypothetical protein
MLIDSEKTYSKYEIIQLGVLGKTEPTVRKKILEDAAGRNILKAKVEGAGRERRYFVKGENLIKYVEVVTA